MPEGIGVEKLSKEHDFPFIITFSFVMQINLNLQTRSMFSNCPRSCDS